jgi:hypothetical protein
LAQQPGSHRAPQRGIGRVFNARILALAPGSREDILAAIRVAICDCRGIFSHRAPRNASGCRRRPEIAISARAGRLDVSTLRHPSVIVNSSVEIIRPYSYGPHCVADGHFQTAADGRPAFPSSSTARRLMSRDTSLSDGLLSPLYSAPSSAWGSRRPSLRGLRQGSYWPCHRRLHRRQGFRPERTTATSS